MTEPFAMVDSPRSGLASSMGNGAGFAPFAGGFPLMRSGSSDRRPVPDPYGMIPRDSLSNHLIWDPTLVQLQRAPDSIQLYNNSVYDSSPSSPSAASAASLPPRLVSMKATDQPLLRQPSLMRQSSLTFPYSPVPSPVAVDTGAPVAGANVPKATLVRAGSSSSVPAAVTEAMMATLSRRDSHGLIPGMGGSMNGNTEVSVTSEICFSDEKKDDLWGELVGNGSVIGNDKDGVNLIMEVMGDGNDVEKAEKDKEEPPMIMNGVGSEVVGVSPEGLSPSNHNHPLGNMESLHPVASHSNQAQSSETEIVLIG